MIGDYEGKDLNGYVWMPDLRNEEYYYMKDFEHLVVMKVVDFSPPLQPEHWEAVVFEDETCQKVVGRQDFATMREAQDSLEQYVEITLKNRKI